ncbi:hypothetical protein MP228_007184 [Amoeboaphelidium protococcarum]|nr:hypothetical protein MP228_007184 [Amoeboaphelidium protococcarum]
MLGIKLSLASTNHHQTDGQSERNIDTLEEMLRHYVNYEMNIWDVFFTVGRVAADVIFRHRGLIKEKQSCPKLQTLGILPEANYISNATELSKGILA